MTRVEHIRRQLQDLGAYKLSWVLERHEVGEHIQWEATLQAGNEMGAPVAFPEEMDALLREALHDGDMGPLQAGVWVMDILSGRVSPPQPRLGEGPGLHGIDPD
jgi:hypothetical protein